MRMAKIRHGSDIAGIEINTRQRVDLYLEPPSPLPPACRLAIRRCGTSKKKLVSVLLLIFNHYWPLFSRL